MNPQEQINTQIKLLQKIDLNIFNSFIDILTNDLKKQIFVCGNGGSASLADHFCCDFQKITFEKTGQKLNMISLCSNLSLLSAIANDNNYENIFSNRLEFSANKNDLLICISVSGNSKNIINALDKASQIGMNTFGLYGSGGKCNSKTDTSLVVESSDYQDVENLHTTFMHIASKMLIDKLTKKKSNQL